MKKISLLLICLILFTGCQRKLEVKVDQVNEPIMVSDGEKGQEKKEEVKYKIELFAQNLYVPWSMVFTSPQRMLVTERDGKIRVIEDGVLQEEPLKMFSEISNRSEEGLMGLTLDPNYDKNKWLYACLAYKKDDHIVDKIVRMRDEGKILTDETIIFDDIPAARYHAGCRIKFGPDEKLYITTGDAVERQFAQDLETLHGKILRINNDGSIPEDNPFENSPIWSYGHRNPQGIDWHPESGLLFSTEHGPSTFDGPPGGDELNIIEKGGNYGWPLVSHDKIKEGTISPKLVFTPAEAPASGMFYTSDNIPQFTNNFFFGALRGEGIIRVVLSKEHPEEIIAHEKLEGINVGRIRDIVEGPDGAIYFSTSNQDGRGTPRERDDTIYMLKRL